MTHQTKLVSVEPSSGLPPGAAAAAAAASTDAAAVPAAPAEQPGGGFIPDALRDPERHAAPPPPPKQTPSYFVALLPKRRLRRAPLRTLPHNTIDATRRRMVRRYRWRQLARSLQWTFAATALSAAAMLVAGLVFPTEVEEFRRSPVGHALHASSWLPHAREARATRVSRSR
jgi:hypothetical protein